MCLATWCGARELPAAGLFTPRPVVTQLSPPVPPRVRDSNTSRFLTSRPRLGSQKKADIRILGESLELSGSRMNSPVTMSDDGSVVVGYGTLDRKAQYLIWNAATGNLTQFSQETQPQPTAVSGDGQVSVGRWTGEGGSPFYATPDEIKMLAPGTGSGQSTLDALSGDGRIAAGVHYLKDGETTIQLWRPNRGYEPVAKAMKASVNDITADGSVVVGSLYNKGKDRAYYWTESSGLRTIEPLSETAEMAAQAISAEGKVIVGSYQDKRRTSAFCWSEERGLELLPELRVADYSIYTAHDVSSDGRMIVGGAGLLDAAVIWMLPSRTARDLRRVLIDDHNLSDVLKDLELTEAVKVSSDGTRILCRARRAMPGKTSFLTQTVLVYLPPR